MTTANATVKSLSASDRNAFAVFMETNEALIETLAEAMAGRDVSAQHWMLVDELKGALGAAAANDSSDNADDQEEALCAAEGWVTDNISHAGNAATAAMALWLRGAERGTKLLGMEPAVAGWELA